jgi:hypothetical protein
MFFIKGAAPPPSRKFIETPELLPALLEANPPSKYGARLTSVSLYVPGARIPATLMPTFGFVSRLHLALCEPEGKEQLQLTVANDRSVHNKR